MKSKTLVKKWATIIGGATVVAFSVIVIFLPNDTAVGGAKSMASADQAISKVLPVRLKIPAINVDAAIESVGLTPEGAMGAPEGPDDVAWFNLGTRPGENGSAVIDGHSGWKDGIPAVFDTLHALHKGDKIYVEDEKGSTTTFVVRELRTLGAKEDATSVFSSSDGKEHLNLITGEGTWDPVSRTSSERLIVFADKE